VTRRKSRPLFRHEIVPSLHSSQEDADHASTQTGSQQQLLSSQRSAPNDQDLRNQSFVFSALPEDNALNTIGHEGVHVAPPGPSHEHGGCEKGGQEVSKAGKGTSSAPSGASQAHTTAELINSVSQLASSKRRPGSFANRRSSSLIINEQGGNAAGSASTSYSKACVSKETRTAFISRLPQPLKRTQSLVRLSTSLDGKAEVTTKTGTTPSPPRRQPVLFTSSAPRASSVLQRSFSAIEPGQPRRSITGRSRDARTWEFYCDSDARNALTEQAECEESGSATAAIGLIRSRSNSSKNLTPNPNKRNAHVQKHDSIKRLKADEQRASKPKLGRTTSSVARLQTTTANGQKQKEAKTVAKHRKSNSQSTSLQEHDGDSDKENWIPGTQTIRPPKRKPVTSQTAARILLESLREPSQSSSLDSLMNRASTKTRRVSSKIPNTEEEKENSSPGTDEEVAAFMGTAPREEEDLDCVQNLLSLSQAAWK